jgi:uncharacterized protein YjbI with pentapeptide repeats
MRFPIMDAQLRLGSAVGLSPFVVCFATFFVGWSVWAGVAGAGFVGEFDLVGVDFSGVDFSGVDFSGVVFSGVDFGVEFVVVDLGGKDFVGVGTSWSELGFVGVALDGVDFVSIEVVDFVGVDMEVVLTESWLFRLEFFCGLEKTFFEDKFVELD